MITMSDREKILHVIFYLVIIGIVLYGSGTEAATLSAVGLVFVYLLNKDT